MSGMQECERLLRQGMAELGLPDGAVPALLQYQSLLLEKNQVMNLTAITDPVKATQLHLLDCLALNANLPLAGKRVLDVGTGAGFPGMVLKLAEPTIRLTLLDSLAKRINWLTEISAELGVPDITCIHGRAEEFANTPTHRQGYDLVTSRAVAELQMLCELCLPFVREGGHFVAMKSVDCDDELARAGHAIRLLGGRLVQCIDYTIPTTDVTHRLVILEKTGPTPKGFPRRFAKIQKNPL